MVYLLCCFKLARHIDVPTELTEMSNFGPVNLRSRHTFEVVTMAIAPKRFDFSSQHIEQDYNACVE